jgi:multidrug efflux system outer membrane protein
VASYEIDFWGRLAQLSRSARSSLLATEEARRVVQLSLIAEIAKTYYTLLHLQELAELSRNTIRSREESLEIIAKARDIGGTYDYEYQLASGILASTKAGFFAIEQQIAATKNQLDFLIGHKVVSLPQGLPLSEQGMADTSLEALPSEVLLSRPDVISAEHRLLALHANVNAARAAFFPRISLNASLGAAGAGLASIFTAGAWALQPLIAMPIFDAGRTEATLDLAHAREISAVAEYEKTIQIAFREVSDQMATRATLAKQYDAVIRYREAQRKRMQISQARFDAGLLPYMDVLESQRELLAAEQSVSQIRRSQLDSAAMFYKVLGGGSQTDALNSVIAQGNEKVSPVP